MSFVYGIQWDVLRVTEEDIRVFIVFKCAYSNKINTTS